MIYLDNAATTFPKPICVRNAVKNALVKYGANPGRSGHTMSLETSKEIYETRKTVSDFFGADGPECVAFTMNCTYAANMLIKGILKKGDHVVISCLEHNAIARPIFALKEKGISVTESKVYENDDISTIDSFRKSINENTRLVICMHASNVFGLRLPIEKISALCKIYGIPIMVDAAQSAGVLPIDMKRFGIDYLCTSGHKGLYGPTGTGIMIVSKEATLSTIIEGGTGTNSISTKQPETIPDRFESGTPNVSGICGLKSGIEFVKKQGIEKIFNHEYSIAEYIYNKLYKMPEVELYTKGFEKQSFVPLISFNFKEKDSESISEELDKNGICVRAGLHCAPLAHKYFSTIDRGGTVRVCPSIFTQKKDVDYFLNVIKKMRTTLYK